MGTYKVIPDQGNDSNLRFLQICASESEIACTFTLTTFNPVHESVFLLTKVNGTFSKSKPFDSICCRKETMYGRALHRLQKTIPIASNYSYHIVWHKKGSDIHHTSYFNGHSIKQVLDKFYHEKDDLEHDYIIESAPV